MLYLNKFLLFVNAGLLVSNVYLHHLGLATLAAVCILLNLTTINSIEGKNDELRTRE